MVLFAYLKGASKISQDFDIMTVNEEGCREGVAPILHSLLSLTCLWVPGPLSPDSMHCGRQSHLNQAQPHSIT